jgi:hypothetical protein
VVALKVGRPLVGAGGAYPFAFVVLTVVIAFAAVGAFRLPSSAGESIRHGTGS